MNQKVNFALVLRAPSSLEKAEPGAKRLLSAMVADTLTLVPSEDAEALFKKGCAYDLGLCYKNGHGVPQDHAQAVHWYRKAAEQGNAIAQRNLGFCYVYGSSVSQNPVEACKWFRLAADQGDSQAKEELAAPSALMCPAELAESGRIYEEYSKHKEL